MLCVSCVSSMPEWILFFHIFSWQVHQLGEASPGPARYNVQGELAKYLGEVHHVEENGKGP